jgi:polyketide synthase PksL
MIDFIEYVVAELKSRRLSKENALQLIRQFSGHGRPAQPGAALHPLLQRNISDLQQQCYGSRFHGDEFFLADHQVVVDGAAPLRVLPGVAYLEMARAAVANAWPGLAAPQRIQLLDVVWIKPIVVAAPVDVFVALSLAGAEGVGGDEIEFEIFSQAGGDAAAAPDGGQDDDADGEVVHCRGRARLAAGAAPEPLDLAALQQRMAAGAVEAETIYPAYRRMGMQFGPAHQPLRRVLRGRQELVAQLALPAAVGATLAAYELHPSLMDGALQAAIGLLGDPQQVSGPPSLPFALESLQVFSPCQAEMQAWVRQVPDRGAGDKLVKLDIDLCDAQGRVCVQLRGFSSRALGSRARARRPGPAADVGLVMARPAWRAAALEPAGAAGSPHARQHVLLCGLPGVDDAQLRPLLPQAEVHALPAGAGPDESADGSTTGSATGGAGLAQGYLQAAQRCLELLRPLLAGRTQAVVQLVVPDAAGASLLLGLSGLLKSAALEGPQLQGQVLLVGGPVAPDELAARLAAEAAQPRDAVVRLRGDAREVLAWEEVLEEGQEEGREPHEGGGAAPAVAFKEGGVYLITGGLGGLGSLFAAEILQRTAGAKVVLTGRAGDSPQLRQKLDALAAAASRGGSAESARSRIEYRALDLADPARVRELVDGVVAAHGGLNGILHSAGMIADGLLARKTADGLAQVLAPKVLGTVHLDAASRHLDLDFLALFSSAAAVRGNPGQADYAAANGFLDQFALLRNRWVAEGRRRGATVAIDWPLWEQGGMRMPQHQQDALREAAGMVPMQTATGLHAFQRCLQAGAAQTLVAEGEPARVRQAIFGGPEMPAAAQPQGEPPQGAPADATPAAATGGAAAAPAGDLAEPTRDYLRRQFSALFKLPYGKLDPSAPLEDYGIDSVLAMDLTRQLEKSFGPLSKTLFFEHQTIDELTAYFVRAHAPVLAALFQAPAQVPMQEAAPVPAAPTVLPATGAMPPARRARGRRRELPAHAAQPPQQPSARDPIAIVGLSARYPESPDAQAFWDNLRDGKDCITEVPRDRWDWRDYYSPDRSAAGAHYSKWGGFIEGVDEFDPLFFNIPPVDAELIDPQERLFLQHAWMALEDAGCTRAGLQALGAEARDGQGGPAGLPGVAGLGGQVGVYVGVMYGEYQLFGAEASLRGRRIGVPVSYASIANRVSYFLNLHGPSLTLDTMCSSSLTAIHLACQDLKQGRTRLAIAGGVNVTIHPNKYLILSAGQFISSDGHCQSFGEGGDGYIPGEGVGAVVLKRLSDALRDGNHVYGVIRGSALNHGGKTNGYSVPNPKAQAAVIDQALQEQGVDPRHLSYIEAHGTGTRLGDPIEIAALDQVFRRHTDARGFCAIGSVKSNIGHCESAAGIAGLTKVLLQMKHRMIVPSLHSAVLNPHIDFERSAFVVNQALQPWEPPVVDGRRVPRIAGISSFGAGGSNAHLIVEEHPAAARPGRPAGTHGSNAPAIVPLSARTADQLQQKVRDLLAFLRRQPGPVDLASLAGTLQLGREAMDHRLACVADSVEQLMDKLDAHLRGEGAGDGCFQGRVERNEDGLSTLGQDEDMQEAIGKWIARRKLAKLAGLWVRGLAVDWRRLHGGHAPALMSLPAYPFAKERYWVARRAAAAGTAPAPVLHPLVHANTSDFAQQSYASAFSGDEFFLADHRIGAAGDPQRVLPGVACLEMARAALALAWPAGAAGRPLAIRHVAWPRPFVAGPGRRLAIVLVPAADGAVDFEVRSGEGEEAVVHCLGQAEPVDLPPAQPMDLQALQAQMTQGPLAAADVYAAYQAMGVHYGPSFRCVTALHRGDGQLLAELALPQQPEPAPADGYVLHPALLDSALQAAIGLVAGRGALPGEPSVPFALKSLQVAAPCTPRMFAWVRHAAAGAAGPGLREIDIDLFDPQGRLCAKLQSLSSRTMPLVPAQDAPGTQDAQDAQGLLLACPQWQAAPAPAAAAPATGGRHQVALCGLPHLDAARLQAALPDSDAVVIALPGTPDGGSTGERYRAAALAVLERLQALLKAAPAAAGSFQLVIADDGGDAPLAGLSGLVDTARLEHPQLTGQLLLVESDIDEAALAQHLLAARARPGESLLRCRGGAQQVQRWQPMETGLAADEAAPAFRSGGVYLVTGGLGGLGMLFAQEIFRQAPDAVVVLSGRAAPGAGQRGRLEAAAAQWSVPAGRLVYRQMDLARSEDVEAAVAAIVAQFGTLTGILHGAGMTRDGLLVRKTPADLAQVLEPKLQGTLHLDQATQRLPLDFMVLFSSVAAAQGNAGQADYAAANGFMDRWAAHRNGQVAAGRRHGRTLSILWPLWQDGGMRMDAQVLERLTQASGMVPLQTARGMQAFHRSLALGADRVLVLEGQLARLQRALRGRPAAPAPAVQVEQRAEPAAPLPQAGTADADAALLQARAQRYLIDQFAGLLKMPAHEVDAKAPLEQYGMDSVLAMKLTGQLERSFGSLSKTLFFEYQTIAALAGYLLRAFPAAMREQAGLGSPAAAPRGVAVPAQAPAAQAAQAPVPARLPVPVRRGLPAPAALAAQAVPAGRAVDDVAIIGVSGRYPQADNLREFWQNLKDGRDCITEVPAERWNHARFFHPSRNQPGKTYSKWGGFLSGIDRFDALFFGISPKEAELIDPQERLFIETVWETIEDAGYSKEAIARGRVGVYVGAMWGHYELHGNAAAGAGVPSSSFASIANRVSYFFNFRGPSLALDTMCSSSLTAIHLACEELRKGAIDVAVAGGVNVSIHPHKYLSLSQGNFASTDGRCRSFGEGGDGYVPGEGVGAVLLKPLQQALADGDQIHAVIKASAINHGGKTNGYTVPNPVAQSELIAGALAQARIDPATLGYIEAHGTGTSLGDPIEITGLVRAMEQAGRPGAAPALQRCPIGSLKSNIGHLEAAAGIAAVTKVLLQFRHGQLVPSLHAERTNPHIDFAATPFYVQRTLQDWPRPAGHPRRVAVSSFGAGGSNAHLILEDFEAAALPAPQGDGPQAVLLSARHREGLAAYVRRMVGFLQDAPPPLADIAFTSQLGRTPMPERLAVVADSVAALRDKLQQWLRQAGAGAADAPEAPAAPDQRARRAGIDGVHEGRLRDAPSGAGALIDGDAGRAFLQVALAQRDLARLAALWTAGVEVDWAALHRAAPARRVSLPTYPFARERYWIDAAVPAADRAPEPVQTLEAALAPAPQDAPQLRCYRPAWQPVPPAAPEAGAPGDEAGALLCLGADDAVLGPLVRHLERRFRGRTVVSAHWAGGYARLGAGRYGVDPCAGPDFAALLQDMAAQGALPAAIVLVPPQSGDLQQQLDRGVFALHGLCQALMAHKPRGVRIVALQPPGAGDAAALHRALAGYLKSLALENPRFTWKLLSQQWSEHAAAGAELPVVEQAAQGVADELGDASGWNRELRHLCERQGDGVLAQRQQRSVESLPQQAIDAAQQAGPALRQQGAYLVTGGLGGLGYLFSRHLVEQYGAKLVLTGRSPLDAPLQAKLAALRAHSSRHGGQDGDVVYLQADVSDASQAQAAVSEARRRFGRLHGVIHGAGIHRDAFVLNKPRDEMAAVLAAKVHGAVHLDQATREDDLDLFVLFSSVAGAFGNPGQCDYAYANGFLDALAQQRQGQVQAGLRRGRTLSVNWPLWEEGGMQIAPSDIELIYRRSGIAVLPTATGLQCWETLLRTGEAQGIVLYGDAAKIQAYLARSGSEKPAAAVAATAAATAAALPAAMGTAAPGGSPQALRAAAEGYLKALLGAEIKLPADRIDAQERFDAFGVDSMMISRINARLEQDLGELPKTLFYEYATIEELAGYLQQEMRPALARCLAAAGLAAAPAVSAVPAVRVAPAAPVAGPVPARPVEPPADVPAGLPAGTPVPAAAAHRAAASPRGDAGPIAIIGMHGRFPRSESLDAYWRNLREGRDLIDLVPAGRWDAQAFFDADPEAAKQGRIYCKWGGFLDGVDQFDAPFFSVAPEDARMIDPQERLFIQSVWAAIEDAGYTRDSLKKRFPKARSADVGVFVGVTTNSYHLLTPDEWNRGNMVSPGSLPWSIANRVSYFFDFQGPSMPIDTACSSSLVAIHFACESLKNRECQVAVAGGVNLYLHPSKYQSLCRRRMLAVDGKCRSFGGGDDGFVPGEGVGSVVLKPLERAIADGDHIYGVVAASACEHSGRSNGYSAPNPSSQAWLMEHAMNKAGIGPESIGYVEGHGTGTQLGDSVEVVSMTQAFRKRTRKKQYCPLGSVKANVGHAESAAGMAGVAKILLQFKHREIAPTIHSEQVNPNIDFANSPFYLQHRLAAWEAPAGQPRRAMINSFGAGGVNACLILEEYDAPAVRTEAAAAPQLIVLSARNEARLREHAAQLQAHLEANDADLRQLAYTLQAGREAMEQRLAVVAASVPALLRELAAYAGGLPGTQRIEGRVEPHRRRKLRAQDDRDRLRALFERADLEALARLWAEGQDVDWDDLHGAARPGRLALPTYPFARERYWVSDAREAGAVAAGTPAAGPCAAGGMEPARPAGPVQAVEAAPSTHWHPLAPDNVSTLREVGFSFALSGREWYGRDHQVNGEPLFPGAGFVEIAALSGVIAGEAPVARIEDIVWMQPLRLAAGPLQARALLKPSGDGAEVTIVSFDDEHERVVHAEARVVYGRAAPRHDRPGAEPRCPLQELKARATRTVPGDECYRQLESFGFHYGESFRTLQELHIGDGFALSRLSLADARGADFDQYLLHPSLVDGALQTVLGLAGGGEARTPYLPFALGAVQILQPLPRHCFVLAEPAVPGSAPSEIRRFNLRLLNAGGEVLVKLNDFCVRALRAAAPRPAATGQAAAREEAALVPAK